MCGGVGLCRRAVAWAGVRLRTWAATRGHVYAPCSAVAPTRCGWWDVEAASRAVQWDRTRRGAEAGHRDDQRLRQLERQRGARAVSAHGLQRRERPMEMDGSGPAEPPRVLELRDRTSSLGLGGRWGLGVSPMASPRLAPARVEARGGWFSSARSGSASVGESGGGAVSSGHVSASQRRASRQFEFPVSRRTRRSDRIGTRGWRGSWHVAVAGRRRRRRPPPRVRCAPRCVVPRAVASRVQLLTITLLVTVQ